MQHYELLYIIPAKYTTEEVKPIVERLTGLVKTAGGEITKSEDLGKQKLAYPIDHTYHGYYFLNEFDMEPLSLKKLDDNLRLDNDVLRHLLTKKRIKTADEINQEKKAEARILKEKEKEMNKVEEEVKKEEKIEAPAKSKKVSLEELDQKLDEILKSDVL